MRRAALSLLFCWLWAGLAAAQSILTLDQDRLFTDSAYGERVASEIAEASSALREENSRIQAELLAEEARLTEQRATMPREEFRDLAEAFDARVISVRRTQDAKSIELQRRQEQERQAFGRLALPLVAELAAQRGAAVVLDARAVVLSTGGTDITSAAIAFIDARLGDGLETDGSPSEPGATEP